MGIAIVGVDDGGFAKVPGSNGQVHNVAVLVFRVSVNDAAPENVVAFCQAHHRDSVIKNICRLQFVAPKPDEEMVAVANPGLKDSGGNADV